MTINSKSWETKSVKMKEVMRCKHKVWRSEDYNMISEFVLVESRESCPVW